MTMTEYLPLTPIAEGTEEIEAFGSFLCRLARAHSVSVYAMTMHLRTWWSLRHPEDTRAKANVVNGLNPMLCGMGPNVEVFTAIVAEAVGYPNVSRMTFLPLRRALSSAGQGLVRRGRAWCPACLEEAHQSGAVFYDRLSWALSGMKRCHEHKIGFMYHCPVCGCRQAHYHHLGLVDICYRCKQSLRAKPSSWEFVSKPPLYEAQLIALVREVSKGDLAVVDDAYTRFIENFSDYLLPIGKKISRHAYNSPRRPQTVREATRPHFGTFLRRCVSFGVEPVDALCDPVEAAKAACTLEFARLDLPKEVKPRRPSELVVLAEERFRFELSKTDHHSLLSIAAIARELGVSKGFLDYHLKSLIQRYKEHRLACLNVLYRDQRDRALRFLRDGPIERYPSADFPSIDRLVAATTIAVDVGVRVARIAVCIALRERFGRRAFERHKRLQYENRS